MSSSLTRNWLRQNVLPYPSKDRVYTDIDAVLIPYNTIRPKSDVYTYDDGRTQLLLCLHGLLPISYKLQSYNIPINVWITREYPRHPPIVYVVPTNDMLVKPGKFLDVSGRCNIEYMQRWERKSEGCNILALLEAMQDHFSREPPVYAKPKSLQENSSRPSSSITVQKTPPPPSTPLPIARQPITTAADPPPLPPKPGSFVHNHILPSNATTSANLPPLNVNMSSSVTPNSLATRPPPPLPHHSSIPDSGPPQYRTPHTTPPVPPKYQPSSASEPIRQSSSSQSPTPAHLWSTSEPTPPSQTFPSSIASPPPPPILHSAPASHSLSPSQPPEHFTSHLTVSPAIPIPPQQPSIPPPNLLDADDSLPDFTSPASQDHDSLVNRSHADVAAAPPPRPPNPELLRIHALVHEKLTGELASLSQALSLDAERLRAHQADLLTGEPAIRDEMARLEAVRGVCSTVAGRLRQVVDQAEHNVSELRRKGDPEVDELVCSTSIVHNQLINLVAEDNAIEDTVYHLHRALNAGRIDLERFLRTTRVLAEEQFMKRALIEKIQNGMPMGMAMGPYHT